jgi:hypothetical protein
MTHPCPCFLPLLSSVRPPRKSWKNISNLSGGEKTLSSLALVFALHHYKVSGCVLPINVYTLEVRQTATLQTVGLACVD